MQVDWISAFCESKAWPSIGYRPYDTGSLLLVSPDGEVEQKRSRATTVEGSFDSRLLVQSRTGADLFVSGNPVKHIQGHNLYGPCDPTRLFFDAGWEIRKAVGLFPGQQTWESGDFVGPRFTRIDLTRSYRFPSSTAARTWLREVGGTARSRHGGSINTDGTIYFGKHSTRWGMKLYHKGDELQARRKGHRLPDELPQRKALLEWADGVVRFEATLRTPELEKIDIAQWNPLAVWQRYYDKITWNQNAAMTEADMLETGLTTRLRGTLAIWRTGVDLRTVLSKSAFYRQRRELLEMMGVDIASPPPKKEAATEIPPATLDPAGWDPEPLEGYAWNPRQRDLVG